MEACRTQGLQGEGRVPEGMEDGVGKDAFGLGEMFRPSGDTLA